MCVTFHLVKILPDFNECLKTLLFPKPRRLSENKAIPSGSQRLKVKNFQNNII